MNTLKTLSVQTPAQALDAPRIVIERTHHSQSDAGLALLSHLANMPEGCGFDALFDVFAQAKGGPQALYATTRNLQSILFHLVARGQLTVSGKRPQPRVWRLGDLNKRAFTAKTRAAFVATLNAKPADPATDPVKVVPGDTAARAASAALVPYVGLRAPAPRYDVMRGPVYVPAHCPVPRAGSLDFQRVASHGYGC